MVIFLHRLHSKVLFISNFTKFQKVVSYLHTWVELFSKLNKFLKVATDQDFEKQVPYQEGTLMSKVFMKYPISISYLVQDGCITKNILSFPSSVFRLHFMVISSILSHCFCAIHRWLAITISDSR